MVYDLYDMSASGWIMHVKRLPWVDFTMDIATYRVSPFINMVLL